MVALTTSTPLLSLLLPLLSLGGLFIVWWSILVPRLTLAFLSLTLLLGQAVRLPLPGQGGGLLASDVAVVLVLLAAAFSVINGQPLPPRLRLFLSVWTPLLMVFLTWSAVTLFFGIYQLHLDLPAILVAGSYWLRLASHLLLFPALILLGARGYHSASRRLFTGTTLLLLMFGFLQFIIISDFSRLTTAGWDPHIWRLTSTWLDPNFFAAYLLLAVPLSALYLKNTRHRLILGFLATLALLATQSRSGLVAGFLAAALLGPLLWWRLRLTPTLRRHLLTSTILASSLVIMVMSSLWPRLNSLLTDDPTATLRWQSLILVEERLLPTYGLFGSGYNTYQFAAAGAGIGQHSTQHSRAGADNSFLAIWVTTGLPGLLLFCALWLALSGILLVFWIKHRHPAALAALYSLLALTIHSQIVNSFLYGHLLITLAWVTALALNSHPPRRL